MPDGASSLFYWEDEHAEERESGKVIIADLVQFDENEPNTVIYQGFKEELPEWVYTKLKEGKLLLGLC